MTSCCPPFASVLISFEAVFWGRGSNSEYPTSNTRDQHKTPVSFTICKDSQLPADIFWDWQLWIEVAEVQTAASQIRPTYTRAEKQFTLVKPFIVKSVDYKSGPYSGGTVILVHGEVSAGTSHFFLEKAILQWALNQGRLMRSVLHGAGLSIVSSSGM